MTALALPLVAARVLCGFLQHPLPHRFCLWRLRHNDVPRRHTSSYQTATSYLAITLGGGAGLTLALYICTGLPGGHLNLALALANCVFGAFPWKKTPGLILAQILDALVRAANVCGLFKPYFDKGERNFLPGETMTFKYGGVFCTYPSVTNGCAVWSKLFKTVAPMMGISRINNDRVTPAIDFKPVAVGLVVFCLGITTGVNPGYAINPACNLCPRVLTVTLWGKECFTLYHN